MVKKSLKTITVSFFILGLFFIFSVPVLAEGSEDKCTEEPCTGEPFPNPLGEGVTNPSEVIGNVIQAVLGIVGSLALLMFVYGGLTWMLSGGNNERVQKGKTILVWATVGLIVIFASYALVRFVITGITGAGGT